MGMICMLIIQKNGSILLTIYFDGDILVVRGDFIPIDFKFLNTTKVHVVERSPSHEELHDQRKVSSAK